ncbi:MAG: TIGR02646 family protein [Thiopseudomonas sp.]|nr:TIGR02646 family protein [Thiopseudomonas sp.]MCK9465731.1 TIGR02646 family protein [Thiopseudomonas sp.]
MRKLTRGQAPSCLSNYKHGRDKWEVVSTNPQYNEEVWRKLSAMQGSLCAYCESRLKQKKHIEHFFRRGQVPQKTFEWANLFGSCSQPDSCGNYKDNKAPSTIDLAKVCKPDIMDSADYLFFADDGSVEARSGLSPADLEIAQNTIQVFNLNGSSKLVGKRREAARIELPLAEIYYQTASEYAGAEDLEMEQLLDEERSNNLARIESSEHSAVLKQVWSF